MDDNAYFQITVLDVNGDKHHHLADYLPDREGDDYINGELVIDVSDSEQVIYNRDTIISWSWRKIWPDDDIPAKADEKVVEVNL